jgi:hypothetical protein
VVIRVTAPAVDRDQVSGEATGGVDDEPVEQRAISGQVNGTTLRTATPEGHDVRLDH